MDRYILVLVVVSVDYEEGSSQMREMNKFGKSHPNEDMTRDVKPYGKSSGRFERKVAKRTSGRGAATRREPITFETGKKGRIQII